MQKYQPVKGFSKMSREEKVQWLAQQSSDDQMEAFLDSFRMSDTALQHKFESFSENTLSNFHLPWGIVPNVLIDDTLYHVPVVIEESSVVAAASKAAAFWAGRGGFKTLFVSTIKSGQLHFLYHGDQDLLRRSWKEISSALKDSVKPLTSSMEKRGGGIYALSLKKVSGLPELYNQALLEIKTVDSMGANFINTVLESMARQLPEIVKTIVGQGEIEMIMAILSNHTPDSRITMQVRAPIASLNWSKDLSPQKFAQKMKWAGDIALHDKGRAATHNKGIFNGIDGVIIATGNDFRATEATGHAFALKTGKYRALSKVMLEDKDFILELDTALSVGTVGGLTSLHPLAAKSLEILGKPDARTLMKIAAAVGMANNFAAMASLVTTGIQQGHMKMHLRNIINALEVEEQHHDAIKDHFNNKTVSVSAVKAFVSTL